MRQGVPARCYLDLDLCADCSKVSIVLSVWLFSAQERCLTNMAEDLQHYLRFLSAQPDPERWLRTTLLPSLRELLQVHHLSL